MKQAARCWNKAIVELFKNSGYFESDADPCIYYKHVEESFVIAAVYVNDFLIASNDTELLTLKKKRLRKRFDMEDQGKVHYWFSLSSKQNRKQGVLTINQGAYLTSALNRFGMSDCNSAATPTEPGKRFNKIAGDEDRVNITDYHSAIGCLICASIATRTDLSSAVGALSQHMLKPGKEHWIGVKRIFRYIQGTLDYGLLHQSRREGKIHLQGYTDADWAGDVVTRKSTPECLFKVGAALYSWTLKRQLVVA